MTLSIFTITSLITAKNTLEKFFCIFRGDDNLKKELKDLQKSFEESQRRLEKVTETANNLVKLIKMMAKDITTLAAHTAMIEIATSCNYCSDNVLDNDKLIN